MRLLHGDSEGRRLIYAPRDEDRYVRRVSADADEGGTSASEIQVDRRLSQERRLLRKIENSLDDSFDDRKLRMYDTLRNRHKLAMKRIIQDISVAGMSGASTVSYTHLTLPTICSV